DDNGNTINEAFLYSQGALKDLGTLGGTHSQAEGINDSGQVVGYSTTTRGGGGLGGTTTHAFLSSNGNMTDLGTLGGNVSHATGIDDSGQIVGDSTISKKDNYTTHAFLYSNGVMTDLNSLPGIPKGWTLDTATAINKNQGAIVGTAISTNSVGG